MSIKIKDAHISLVRSATVYKKRIGTPQIGIYTECLNFKSHTPL